MDQDSKLITEAYMTMANLPSMAKRMQVLRKLMDGDCPDSVDEEYERLDARFWQEVKKAVRQWLASHGKAKLASAYATEMSDSDVNDPMEIIRLLASDREMMANYNEFLDASG